MILAPSRQIFIPGMLPLARRRRSWIDRIISFVVSNGDVVLDDAGNEITDASGNVFVADGAGSGCQKNQCRGCTGFAPAEAMVSIPTTVHDSHSFCIGGFNGETHSFNLGGTYTLPVLTYGNATTACTYRYSIGGQSPHYIGYNDCCITNPIAGGASPVNTKTITVTLSRDATTGISTCTLTLSSGPAFLQSYFSGSESRLGNCLDPWTIANTHTTSACGTGAPTLTSGPATVTFYP